SIRRATARGSWRCSSSWRRHGPSRTPWSIGYGQILLHCPGRSLAMRVGVPKEIKVLENRVGLTPASVRELVSHGHEVMVEHEAGAGIGLADDAYKAAGAQIGAQAASVFAWAEMIVKVKEPQPAECAMLREGQ